MTQCQIGLYCLSNMIIRIQQLLKDIILVMDLKKFNIFKEKDLLQEENTKKVFACKNHLIKIAQNL